MMFLQCQICLKMSVLTGESDVRAKTKARFDEVLKKHTNPPAQKTKAKQTADQSEEIIVVC